MQNNGHVEALFGKFLQALVKNWTADLVYQRESAVKDHVFLPDRIFFDNFAKTFEAETRRSESAQVLVEAFLGLLPYPNKAKVFFLSSNQQIYIHISQSGVERQLDDLWSVIDGIEEKYPQASLFQRGIEKSKNALPLAAKQNNNGPLMLENKNQIEESEIENHHDNENESEQKHHHNEYSEEPNSYPARKGRNARSTRIAQVCEPIIDFVVSRMLVRIISLNMPSVHIFIHIHVLVHYMYMNMRICTIYAIYVHFYAVILLFVIISINFLFFLKKKKKKKKD
ncbi:hypothetical protein RFI_15639 [Reticulomyxa filosa]|uniref:Uncharacterized protein n=1 Tax=Reticulomyxa filosa TaxID=46433 RepID=X6N8C7_RETFI|nr:hypothetical protein RFI_15639 [Reticulomyxa filosa]|eukprot:ETO21557.1 hypothetical protein RFI_15639 [Reticulomyxa filosa]